MLRFLNKRSSADQTNGSVPKFHPVANGPRVSPTACVDSKALIGNDCEIGPYCVVGPEVTLGSGCKLLNHVVITGNTTVGSDNIFFPHSVIGAIPQDKKYRGENTELIIGDRNHFREAVTVHLGTVQGGGATRVGSGNLLMVNCHIGHDCQVGNNNIIGNNVMLAGHVTVCNNVTISGGAASHHFVTIGDCAFIAGMAQINKDVPPFVKLRGIDKIRAVNTEGLRRAGLGAEDIEEIEDALRKLFFSREKPTFAAALADLDENNGANPRVKQLIDFLRRRDIGKHGRFLESTRPPRAKNPQQ